MFVLHINQTFFLFSVGGSAAWEQWPVVKRAQQTLTRRPEIVFTPKTARKLSCIENRPSMLRWWHSNIYGSVKTSVGKFTHFIKEKPCCCSSLQRNRRNIFLWWWLNQIMQHEIKLISIENNKEALFSARVLRVLFFFWFSVMADGATRVKPAERKKSLPTCLSCFTKARENKQAAKNRAGVSHLQQASWEMRLIFIQHHLLWF